MAITQSTPDEPGAMPQVSRAQTVTWGGRLKINLLNAGAVVHAFQMLDGMHGRKIDAAHT